MLAGAGRGPERQETEAPRHAPEEQARQGQRAVQLPPERGVQVVVARATAHGRDSDLDRIHHGFERRVARAVRGGAGEERRGFSLLRLDGSGRRLTEQSARGDAHHCPVPADGGAYATPFASCFTSFTRPNAPTSSSGHGAPSGASCSHTAPGASCSTQTRSLAGACALFHGRASWARWQN